MSMHVIASGQSPVCSRFVSAAISYRCVQLGMTYLVWAGSVRARECFFFQVSASSFGVALLIVNLFECTLPAPQITDKEGLLSISSAVPLIIQLFGLLVFLVLIRSPKVHPKRKSRR